MDSTTPRYPSNRFLAPNRPFFPDIQALSTGSCGPASRNRIWTPASTSIDRPSREVTAIYGEENQLNPRQECRNIMAGILFTSIGLGVDKFLEKRERRKTEKMERRKALMVLILFPSGILLPTPPDLRIPSTRAARPSPTRAIPLQSQEHKIGIHVP